jgi:hypothetical protein
MLVHHQMLEQHLMAHYHLTCNIISIRERGVTDTLYPGDDMTSDGVVIFRV